MSLTAFPTDRNTRATPVWPAVGPGGSPSLRERAMKALERTQPEPLRESSHALVVRDVLLRRRHPAHLRDGGELEIIELVEVKAALPHVEPLPGLLECVDEQLLGERRCVLAVRAVERAHQVERVVVLLRAKAHVAERLTVVRVGELFERDPPVDHAPV